MAGYQLLKPPGPPLHQAAPRSGAAEVQLSPRASLKGIRAVCHLRLTKDQETVAETQGEVQFTAYGLSGPAIFEISRDACAEPGDWVCHLDLLPDITPLPWWIYSPGGHSSAQGFRRNTP